MILIDKPQQWERVDNVTGIVDGKYKVGYLVPDGSRQAIVILDNRKQIQVKLTFGSRVRAGDRVTLAAWANKKHPGKYKYEYLTQ